MTLQNIKFEQASLKYQAIIFTWKAGFQHACDFIMEGNCSGRGKVHHLLVKRFEPTISII